MITLKNVTLALLNGTLHEDAGEYFIPSQWRMGQVAQDMPETEQSATEFVIEGDTVLNDARAEVKAAEATEDGERLGNAYMSLYDAGEHDAASRCRTVTRLRVLLGLDFGRAYELVIHHLKLLRRRSVDATLVCNSPRLCEKRHACNDGVGAQEEQSVGGQVSFDLARLRRRPAPVRLDVAGGDAGGCGEAAEKARGEG